MRTTFLLLILLCSLTAQAQRTYIDITGQWTLSLDKPDNKCGTVTLPGTTDTNSKGTPVTDKSETTHLSRLHSFVGKAWYSKEIEVPLAWKGKHITLYLERTKPSTLYIDGNEIGTCDDTSVPHVYTLTSALTPGHHTLTLLIDNASRVPKQLLGSSHAYTEDTQTNWNGVIGRMTLSATDCPVCIDAIRTSPSVTDKSVAVSLTMSGVPSKSMRIENSVTRKGATKGDTITLSCRDLSIQPLDKSTYRATYTIRLNDLYTQWSEHTPQNHYVLRVQVRDKGCSDTKCSTFGFVDFKASGHHFTVGGRKTFLRGKHDACVFPLTGHTAMSYEDWHRHLSICKQYGINHVRFHSWCPPEACFKAADDLGIYLQPELPIWGGFDEKDTVLMDYLKDEGRKILNTYGNHPSFVMMGLGNELWGSEQAMADMVKDFRMHDQGTQGARRLYTFGSNMYLGFRGPIDGMDYFTTCRMSGEEWGSYDTHVRGSFSFADAYDGGLINHEYPNTTTNFDRAIGSCGMPVISHETGQFQSYPDYSEIEKYRGVLYPYNMEVFRRRLKEAGMLSQAEDFHRASGRWAVELYKADIEMDLRTANMAGFQLLDLQDYPGQGSAYVGVLDAFMDSKGYVSASKWRQWCNDIVPLAALSKFTYTDGDTISWTCLLSHYSPSDSLLMGKTLKYSFTNDMGETRSSGEFRIHDIHAGLNAIASPQDIVRLSHSATAEHITLTLHIEGTEYSNSYNLWVYPSPANIAPMTAIANDVIITDTLDEATLHSLDSGAKVLLMPRKDMYQQQTVGGLAQTDYWNYRMFKTISENNNKPVSPGTLGILVNDTAHIIFNHFPTSFHTDWQWASILHESRPLIMDNCPNSMRPLVQVIDNIERNHRLGLMFECTVGKGKLFVCSCHLPDIACYPEARTLLHSILSYMRSQHFQPSSSMSSQQLRDMLSTQAKNNQVKELRNISYD